MNRAGPDAFFGVLYRRRLGQRWTAASEVLYAAAHDYPTSPALNDMLMMADRSGQSNGLHQRLNIAHIGCGSCDVNTTDGWLQKRTLWSTEANSVRGGH